MSLWSVMETSAAAEFGRRHYRGILVWRGIRGMAGPALVVAAGAALVWAAATWAVPAIADGGLTAARWSINLVPALIIAGILVVAVPAGAVAWRLWGWRVEIRAPWITGRLVSTAGAVLALAVLTAAAWPT